MLSKYHTQIPIKDLRTFSQNPSRMAETAFVRSFEKSPRAMGDIAMKPGLKRIEAALQHATHVLTTVAPLSPDLRSPGLATVSDRLPDLPEFTKSATPSAETSRQALAHPALASSLLKDLQTSVHRWGLMLQEVTHDIEKLYDEGPIVDGWLESCADEQQDDQTNTYRLCGMGRDGELWCRPCPANQVSDVSFAIARYHRLQILLTRKRAIDTRLSQLTETLMPLHGKMSAPIF
jgi:hypothetical protein